MPLLQNHAAPPTNPGAPGTPPGMPGAAPAGAAPGVGGPTPSPMSTPQPNAGLEKAGRVKMQVIARAIQQEIPNFPFDSKESKALVDVLRKLADTFGKSADEDQGLMKSETLSMMGLLGNKSPGASAMAGKPPIPPPPGAGAPPAPSM